MRKKEKKEKKRMNAREGGTRDGETIEVEKEEKNEVKRKEN